MGIRLLLANKDVQTTRIFHEAVSEIGAEVVVFTSLEPAARAARDEKFDAIFVDTHLPGLTRYEFTRLVRGSKFNGQAPITYLTGYDGRVGATAENTDNVLLMLKPASASGLLPHFKALKRKLVAERRKQRRLPYRTEVQVIRGLRRFRAFSVNLSATGLLLEGTPALEPGDEFEAQFQLEPHEPIFRSRVRAERVDGARRVGVVFQGLAALERQRLGRFLDMHMPPLK